MSLIWILQLPINALLYPGQVEGPCWTNVPFSLPRLMSRGTCCSALLLTMITWFKFYLIDFSIIKLLIFPLGLKNTTPPHPTPQIPNTSSLYIKWKFENFKKQIPVEEPLWDFAKILSPQTFCLLISSIYAWISPEVKVFWMKQKYYSWVDDMMIKVYSVPNRDLEYFL